LSKISLFSKTDLSAKSVSSASILTQILPDAGGLHISPSNATWYQNSQDLSEMVAWDIASPKATWHWSWTGKMARGRSPLGPSELLGGVSRSGWGGLRAAAGLSWRGKCDGTEEAIRGQDHGPKSEGADWGPDARLWPNLFNFGTIRTDNRQTSIP